MKRRAARGSLDLRYMRLFTFQLKFNKNALATFPVFQSCYHTRVQTEGVYHHRKCSCVVVAQINLSQKLKKGGGIFLNIRN